MKQKYCVPVEYTSSTFVYVMAESPEEAGKIVEESIDSNNLALLNEESEVFDFEIKYEQIVPDIKKTG